MEYNEDEFRAHFATLANTTLPPYGIDFGKAVVRDAEGYFNVMPTANKFPAISHMYKVLVHHFKSIYCLVAHEDPSQKPPQQFLQKKDGTMVPH